jgi:hypothetical protein
MGKEEFPSKLIIISNWGKGAFDSSSEGRMRLNHVPITIFLDSAVQIQL